LIFWVKNIKKKKFFLLHIRNILK